MSDVRNGNGEKRSERHRERNLKILRWAVVFLSLALLVVSSYAYDQNRVRRLLANQLEGERQRAFYGLLEDVEGLELSLTKSISAGTPSAMAMHLSEVHRSADSALANLGGIPMSHTTLLRTAVFLNQSGDYARTMARLVSDGKILTDDEKATLSQLREQMIELGSALHELRGDLGEAGHRWSNLQAQQRISYDTLTNDDGVRGLKTIEEDLEQYPTLIYDGPFSDHVFDVDPRGLTGPEITEGEAADRARQVMSSITDAEVSIERLTEARGPIPAYTFSATIEGAQYWMDISKKGGHLVWLTTPLVGEDANLDLDEARQAAVEAVQSLGFDDMVPQFTHKEDNRAITNFVYEQDGVLIYPDQIKVMICLENGSILSVDASSYLIAHTDRDLPEPSISSKEAVERISPALTATDEARLALVPRDNLDEILCWEVPAVLGGEDTAFIVFINAITGDEERVFQLIPVEGGYLLQ